MAVNVKTERRETFRRRDYEMSSKGERGKKFVESMNSVGKEDRTKIEEYK
jgi:hypothetical protein